MGTIYDIKKEIEDIQSQAENNFGFSLDLFYNAMKGKILPDGHFSGLKTEVPKNLLYTYNEDRTQILDYLNESLFRTIISFF